MRPIAAGFVLLGTGISLIGTSWDVQWHIDVGPDTFFTLPHLFIYSGSAIAGIASLVVVLAVTAAQRRGETPDPRDGGIPIRVFGGRFTAPLGYLVTGLGAAAFLVYGLTDLWWHTVYGFDAVLNSPPHVALFTTISITMIGAVIVAAAAREQRWGRIAMAISVPVLMTFFPITANAFEGVPLPFNTIAAATALITVLLLVLARVAIGRRGIALATAAALLAMQAILWVFTPWAAVTYADAVGLPLRDGLGGEPPFIPAGIPLFAVVAAIAIELLVRRSPALAGAVAGLILGFTFVVQQEYLGFSRPVALPDLLASTVAAGLFGLLGGYLGARFGAMLRIREKVTA
ncbi:hypothetical protein [Kutzneria sp. CA-103260]|uniref:hypothetical protein n=1 Tax=Kutzneria sp. CA-103260 TaxID=2802641 RepID=UPI001BA647D2|nr:hypothetical protein [Kutzneria sp. CA-103260]QUQ62451.1 hypothetical protein JJ691_01630 [Kutzneria sp. CA-103260]